MAATLFDGKAFQFEIKFVIPFHSFPFQVTFSRLPYQECLRKSRQQDRIVRETTLTACLFVCVALGFAYKFRLGL